MMMSEEEKQRLIDAQTCNDCLCWHKHCQAECCKIIYLNLTKEETKKRGPYVVVNLGRGLSADEIWYYRLHGVDCTRSSLKFKKERVIEFRGKMMYVHPCRLLDAHNKCKGHPDAKPKICQNLTYESSMQKGKHQLTENCLYKYKRWLKDVEE